MVQTASRTVFLQALKTGNIFVIKHIVNSEILVGIVAAVREKFFKIDQAIVSGID